MSPAELELHVLPDALTVAQIDGAQPVPAWAFDGPGVAAALRRDGELTVVCRTERVPAGVLAESGWRALEVAGPMDFALTGILASVAVPLAEAAVSIFSLSTYDTDLVLVRAERLDEAVAALRDAGHTVTNGTVET